MQIGNAGAVIVLDAPVELDEGPAEVPGEHAPERRLAGAAQADKRDAAAAVGAGGARQARFDVPNERRQFTRRNLRQQIGDAVERRRARRGLGQERGGGKIERLRDRPQHAHRRIAGAALDLRQISLGGERSLRQLPARHPALGAMAPHLAPDRGEKRRRGLRFLLRGRNRLLGLSFG